MNIAESDFPIIFFYEISIESHNGFVFSLRNKEHKGLILFYTNI